MSGIEIHYEGDKRVRALTSDQELRVTTALLRHVTALGDALADNLEEISRLLGTPSPVVAHWRALVHFDDERQGCWYSFDPSQYEDTDPSREN
jgi:hypothetical protein